MATSTNRQAPLPPANDDTIDSPTPTKQMLHGRAFYESLGSPKFVLAPMVDQSEFAWRMLTRTFMTPATNPKLIAYTPMMHARMFGETVKFRDKMFQPLRSSLTTHPDPSTTSSALGTETKPKTEEAFLDGNPAFDRPLFVQFCANDPDEFLNSAKYVVPFCDAVDLNLGCPQGIAKRGKYGAFLQEDQELVFKLINKLHTNLSIPITAKIRILETKEATLEYAKKVLSAGASILTVHGRRREQKGHKTGLADWNMVRYLRDNLPEDTVLFANGNILQRGDIEDCLRVTGADAVMSAEGNLYDPAIFAEAPEVGMEGREYWRGKDGKGGYRMDAVMRRYLDIIYKYVLELPVPERKLLYIANDAESEPVPESTPPSEKEEEGPPRKKQKQQQQPQKKEKLPPSPNLSAMQPHLFHLLRALVAKHHNIRDALAKCRTGDIEGFERVLELVEVAVKEGIREYEQTGGRSWEVEVEGDGRLKEKASGNDGNISGKGKEDGKEAEEGEQGEEEYESSVKKVRECKRPWWVVQPYVRPLPKEALAKGSITLSKKERVRLEIEERERLRQKEAEKREAMKDGDGSGVQNGHIDIETLADGKEKVEVPKEGLVCG